MDRFLRTAFIASLVAFGLLLLTSERVAGTAGGPDSGTSFGEPERVADAR
jgi:hypothetical protein